MQFPTGGKVRERLLVPTRCNSGTDSTVWMEEDDLSGSPGPEYMLRAYFVPWEDMFMENLRFILGCIAIVAILGFGSRLLEKGIPGLRSVTPARRVSIVGICAAIATVLHILDFPLVFLAPEFYKLDFSEVPVLLCGFYLGPASTVACEGVKILLKLLTKGTSTAYVGDLANFVVGCSFVLPATYFYHLHKNKKGAVIGMVLGTLSMAVLGSAFNALYLVPRFAELYELPLEVIIAMGTKIWPGVQNIWTFVLMCVAPLNLVKGTMVSVLTLLLYKRVAKPLFGIHK